MGTVNGYPTSKVDIRTAIPAVRDPAIYFVWRDRDVAEMLILDDEDPERVAK